MHLFNKFSPHSRTSWPLYSGFLIMACCFLAFTHPSEGGTFTYEVKALLHYPVVQNGIVLPGTSVWGLPDEVFRPSGRLILDIDAAGNVTGATPLDPVWGLGTLQGQRLYAMHNSQFQIMNGSWGTPTNTVAPITGGTVNLMNTFLGDFSGLVIVDGFIQDGNSGNGFDLTNGLGLDGKFEFTAVSPAGISYAFRAKGTNTGAGTGWHGLSFDVGDISYTHGTDTASVGLVGVVPYSVFLDTTRQSFFFNQETLLLGFPAEWFALGRSIDSFTGHIDSSGNFIGSAHFAGIDFTNFDFTTSNGHFNDGNSEIFNVGCNGLAPQDTFSMVLTDSTGNFDFILTGTLLEQSVVPCPSPIICTADCAPIDAQGFYGDGQINIIDLITLINHFDTDYPPCDFVPIFPDGTVGDGVVNYF